MLDEQSGFKRIRMVVVDLLALFERKISIRGIIAIMFDDDDVRIQLLDQPRDNGGFCPSRYLQQCPTMNGFTGTFSCQSEAKPRPEPVRIASATLDTTPHSVKSEMSLFQIRSVPEITQDQLALG